jgi:Protein of unknown function (DUF2934)
MDDRQEKIRRRAHEIWEEKGKPEGSELDFWLQAEKEISADSESAPEVPPNDLATRLE